MAAASSGCDFVGADAEDDGVEALQVGSRQLVQANHLDVSSEKLEERVVDLVSSALDIADQDAIRKAEVDGGCSIGGRPEVVGCGEAGVSDGAIAFGVGATLKLAEAVAASLSPE